MKLKNLLYSSWTLYFVVFIVFFNIVGHALNGNYMAILFFILVSFLTTFFSKNMIVVLVLGIVAANILVYGPKRMSVEGFANAKKAMADSGADSPSPFDVDDLDEKDDTAALSAKDFKLDKVDSSNNQEKLKQKMDEFNEVKKRIQTMKENLPKSVDKTNLNGEELDLLNSKFGEFLKLQENVLSNIGSLEKSIQSVDTLVKDIRTNVDKIQHK